MEITNGEIKVDLPDALAALLVDGKGWEKARRSRSAGARVDARAQAAEDEPIPMTHIPGVVDGISMNKLKRLIAEGAIPYVLDGRTKLVRPSDVQAFLALKKD